MKIDNETKPPIEEALAHFGVKGQKWGVRNAKRTSSASDKARDEAKARRIKARANRNSRIDAARERSRSGQHRRQLKAIRTEFKTNKKTVGRSEARKTRSEKRAKVHQDIALARELKTGREMTTAVLITVGSIAIRALMPH